MIDRFEHLIDYYTEDDKSANEGIRPLRGEADAIYRAMEQTLGIPFHLNDCGFPKEGEEMLALCQKVITYLSQEKYMEVLRQFVNRHEDIYRIEFSSEPRTIALIELAKAKFE